MSGSDNGEAERRPLLQERTEDQIGDSEVISPDAKLQVTVTGGQLWGVYVSHFLSTWNSRCYEFAALITLGDAGFSADCRRADSLYGVGVPRHARSVVNTVFILSSTSANDVSDLDSGLLANLSAMCLSSAVGRWADKHPSRLRTLQTTILLQRLCICLACVGWAFIISVIDNPPLQTLSKGGYDYPREVWLVKTAIMAAVIVLGMGERLAAVGNMLVMERDWACCSFHPARRRTWKAHRCRNRFRR
ncbi:MAG: hypothetical protein M1813_009747 [Trichoglossum hirsutum]|nr:MAG: hypothetical protein M1813_009747 [Trichoglossum hirsutum]